MAQPPWFQIGPRAAWTVAWTLVWTNGYRVGLSIELVFLKAFPSAEAVETILKLTHAKLRLHNCTKP